mmetsp:Transcript_42611/g.90618  ORF Transcript_42611/g.90618 Transcript_42611/m.90618 type:complete len:88 (-) Transcript_42611:62-325(-)
MGNLGSAHTAEQGAQNSQGSADAPDNRARCHDDASVSVLYVLFLQKIKTKKSRKRQMSSNGLPFLPAIVHHTNIASLTCCHCLYCQQ